jgi:hypothetical protein
MKLAILVIVFATMSIALAAPNATVFDSLANLYPDSNPTAGSQSTQLDVARGGTVAVHILLTDLPANATIDFSPVESSQAILAKWFRLIDVPVEKNTGPVGFIEGKPNENPHVTRRAPFRVYDAMEPIISPIQTKSTSAALRVHLPIAATDQPGQRNVILRLRVADQTIDLGVAISIHKAIIPPVGAKSFPYTNWFNLNNMASRHNLKPWSEDHWSMIAQYARLMAHARQNTFWVVWGDVFTREKTGLVLNRPRLNRLVKTFTDAGLYYIEGGHVASRTGGKWTASTFDMSIGGPLATSPEGNADLARACKQLMEEIDKNNWRTRWIQHVTDEPAAENGTDYRILVGMVRKYMPGLPILDATMNTAMAGSVNIWCPQVQEFQKHRDIFRAQQAIGDKVWFYTCCFPGGPWTNRLMDMELLRPAYLGWGAALYDLDGFLHWGFNMYNRNHDPFNQSVVPHGEGSFLPAGDTHIVYPGKDAPWSSVRLESQREGIEDYELLKILKSQSPAKAEEIIRQTFRAFDDFSKDTQVFRSARKSLLDAMDQ